MNLNKSHSILIKDDSRPFVSVVLPTYGREELLCKAIESLITQDYPEFEIIVVDQTPVHKKEIEDFLESVKDKVRYFKLEQADVSKALNFGISKAIGEIIAFTEDDAQTAPTWLAESVKVMLLNDAKVVGGKIVPDWETSPPGWFSRFSMLVSAIDLGPLDRRLSREEVIFGGNMLIKKEVIEKVGLYDEALGRKGKNLLSNEDVDMCNRIMEMGYAVWWAPKAVVHHFVPKERLRRRWLICRSFWQGISEYIQRSKRKEISLKTWIILLAHVLGNTLLSPFSFLRFLYLLSNLGFLSGVMYKRRTSENSPSTLRE